MQHDNYFDDFMRQLVHRLTRDLALYVEEIRSFADDCPDDDIRLAIQTEINVIEVALRNLQQWKFHTQDYNRLAEWIPPGKSS